MKHGRYLLNRPRMEALQINHDERVDRYLKIVRWADRRYRRDGSLTTFVGCAIAQRAPLSGGWAVPTRFSVIEDIAATELLGLRPRWPGETLNTAFAA